MGDLERDIVRLQERVARLESPGQRFYDIMPAAVNIAVILFVIVQLMGFDDRLDGVEQRMDALEQRMSALERNQERILDLLDER
jgi:ubiquinone biosynthesis protein UbiJ